MKTVLVALCRHLGGLVLVALGLLALVGCSSNAFAHCSETGNSSKIGKEVCWCEERGGWVGWMTPSGYCEMNNCTENVAGTLSCQQYRMQIPLIPTVTSGEVGP